MPEPQKLTLDIRVSLSREKTVLHLLYWPSQKGSSNSYIVQHVTLQSFMVVSTILDRNPELSFRKPVDMDKVRLLKYMYWYRGWSLKKTNKKT